MPSDTQRLSVAIVTAAAFAIGGCHSSAPRSGTDSPNAPTRMDSAPSNQARSDSVSLRTDKAQYRAGETMTLTFENKSAAQYTFSPCSRSVERAGGATWKVVDEPGRMCTMEAWVLDPHATRTGATELPTPLAPGRYRVVVRMGVARADGTSSFINAVSDPFTVS